jgi:isoquinoline 1-oxidoreductase alpha subunit
MQAIALLTEDSNPSDEKITNAMEGILCRCGTYTRIKRAIKRVIKEGKKL